jgi:hypothetical protein
MILAKRSLTCCCFWQVLDHDGLVCLNEFQVFKAAMTWISESPATRAVHVPKLLDTIRFKNMSEGMLRGEQGLECLRLVSGTSLFVQGTSMF